MNIKLSNENLLLLYTSKNHTTWTRNLKISCCHLKTDIHIKIVYVFIISQNVLFKIPHRGFWQLPYCCFPFQSTDIRQHFAMLNWMTAIL